MSLIILMVGAICFFGANILLKKKLTITEYGEYSILVSYFSLGFIYGLLGLEQVFIRFSQAPSRGKIITQRFQIKTIITTVLTTSVLSTILFYWFYSEILPNILLVLLSTVSMTSLMYFFSAFRLNTDFVFAQFISNLWRIALLILAVSLFLFRGTNASDFILYGLCYSIILCFLLAVYYYRKEIKLEFNEAFTKKEILISGFHFCIAITSFSLITFGDRFLIENKLGIENFGEYFYLTNFFLAPYTILQNYVGFKQLILFKANFNKKYFSEFNRKAILFGLLLGFLLALGVYILNSLRIIDINIQEHWSTILLILLTGILRLYSSSINSAFEARTSIETLRKANIYIASLTVILILIIFLFINSIDMILICISLIWFLRSVIHRHLLMHQMKTIL